MSNKDVKQCPVELAMKLINKKWVIQIIRDMFFGKSHFNEFKEDKPKLSNKVLSNCLKDMEENGLVEKIVNTDDTFNIEYHLTQKGLALNKVVYELAMFSITTDVTGEYFTDDDKENIRKSFKESLNID